MRELLCNERWILFCFEAFEFGVAICPNTTGHLRTTFYLSKSGRKWSVKKRLEIGPKRWRYLVVSRGFTDIQCGESFETKMQIARVTTRYLLCKFNVSFHMFIPQAVPGCYSVIKRESTESRFRRRRCWNMTRCSSQWLPVWQRWQVKHWFAAQGLSISDPELLWKILVPGTWDHTWNEQYWINIWTTWQYCINVEWIWWILMNDKLKSN